MDATGLANRLAQELSNRGIHAHLGLTQGAYGHKVTLANGQGNIVVYTGKKGPSYVTNEIRSLSPELAECIRMAWSAARGLGDDQLCVPEQFAQTIASEPETKSLQAYAFSLSAIAQRCSELDVPVDWPPVLDAIDTLAVSIGKVAPPLPSARSTDLPQEWIAFAEAIAVEFERRFQTSNQRGTLTDQSSVS